MMATEIRTILVTGGCGFISFETGLGKKVASYRAPLDANCGAR